jgi:hypothetical protein
LRLKSYQSGTKLETALQKDIDKLHGFKGDRWASKVVLAKDVKVKEYRLAIPPEFEIKPDQALAIKNMIEYAKLKNINFKLVIIK